MPALWDSKMTFVLVSLFLGISLVLPFSICLWTLRNSKSYCLTWGKKEKKRGRGGKRGSERKKKSLLLTLNLFSEFCGSS